MAIAFLIVLVLIVVAVMVAGGLVAFLPSKTLGELVKKFSGKGKGE